MTIDVSAHDRFVLRQRVKLVINQYEFSVPGEADDGEAFCFVEQKRFAFKEDIRFFADDSKTAELWRILARQRFDPRATYDITTPDGTVIGTIQKEFGKSLLRSTFTITGANGACTAREISVPKALFRRALGFVPYVDSVADWLPIAFDFEFLVDGERLGINRRRRFKWRDIYDIDFTDDTNRILDRRLMLSAVVGMDALMAR